LPEQDNYLQIVRADFRNPVSRAIVQLPNPVILPLRRVLPPIGTVDTASLVALILVTVLKLWILLALLRGIVPPPSAMLTATLLELVRLVLRTYLFSIILNALLSFVAPGNYSPVQALLYSLCEPVLRPFRRVIPPVGGLDLSPLVPIILIQALLIAIR
jgi:YggT family protein